MADRLKADSGRAAKLLFLTTADTEILAAAKAAERLPDGFPSVRCANPVSLDDPAAFFAEELPGARAVLDFFDYMEVGRRILVAHGMEY